MKTSRLVYVLLVTVVWVMCASCGSSTNDNPDGDVDVSEDGDEAENVDGDADEAILISLEALDGLVPFEAFNSMDSFFAAPFPSDYRMKNGKPDMAGYPNPSESSLITKYVEVAESELEGFGNNAPVYFKFESSVNVESLPTSQEATLEFNSALLLLNVDPDSDDYGMLTPVDWHWQATPSTYEPANLLAFQPVNGFPLDAATTYAAILTDSLEDADGASLGRSQLMADLLSGRNEDKLGTVYAPLAEWLQNNQDKLNPERIRSATVFTTLDPVSELKQIRDYIAQEYPGGELEGEVTSCEFIKKQDEYLWFEGTYTSPNFQEGEIPYATEGGKILFDENGNPIPQFMEELRFAICVPDDSNPPEDGWPIVMQAHGTGGSYTSYIGKRKNDESKRLLAVNLAMVGIDQPLHGPRGDWLSADQVDIYSFNFNNPVSARSNFRQSAADTFALTQMIKSGKLKLDKAQCGSWPPSLGYEGPDIIKFSTDMILFHGHSHGGLSGALAAAVEPDVKGWFLSGAGGRMAITMMERQEPNILELITLLAGLDESEAHVMHPLFGLVQMLVEITDPINYAPYWIAKPFDGRARNIYATSGFKDAYTPMTTAEAMAVAGRLPLIEPVAKDIPEMDLRGIEPLARPASNTVEGPDGVKKTAGFSQYPDDGHFAIYDNDDAASMVQEYLRSIAYDGTGVLGY